MTLDNTGACQILFGSPKMSDNLVTHRHHLISLESLRSVNKVATSSSALMTLALALVRAMKFIERPYSSATQPPLSSAEKEWIIQGCIKRNSKNVSLGAPAAHSLQLYSRASAHLISCCGIQARGANSNKFVARDQI